MTTQQFSTGHISTQTFRTLLLLCIAAILAIACQPTDSGSSVTNPLPPERTNIYIDSIEITQINSESLPFQYMAVVKGNLADGCVVLDSISSEQTGNTIHLTPISHREGDMCTEALVSFEEQVMLVTYDLDPGTYQVIAGETSAEFTVEANTFASSLSGEITGTLLIRGVPGSLELPSNAIVTIRLDDISLADAASVEISAIQLTDVAELPIEYSLPYDKSLIVEGNSYAVSAEVTAPDGKYYYITDTIYSVLTDDASESADIELLQVR